MTEPQDGPMIEGKKGNRKRAIKVREPKKRGRPANPIDYAIVEALETFLPTDHELESTMQLAEGTAAKRKRWDKEFRQAYTRGRERGKMSLRRMQWTSAEGGSVQMQIWLGKQYLDQKDHQEVEHSGQIDSDIHIAATIAAAQIAMQDPENAKIALRIYRESLLAPSEPGSVRDEDEPRALEAGKALTPD